MAERVRRQLAQCEADQLLKVAARCRDQVDFPGAVIALHRLARDTSFRANGKDRRLEGILDILRRPLLRGEGLDEPRHFGNISWSFARLSIIDEPLLDVLTAEAIARVENFTCQELATTTWAFAKLETMSPTLMDSITRRSKARLAEFSSSHLANVSWAVGKLLGVGCPLMDAIATQALPTVHDFPVQDMSSLAWALARLRSESPALMRAISKETLVKIDSMNPVDFTNMSWAFAELNIPVDDLTAAISAEVRCKLRDFSSQELSSWLWAFSKMSVEDSELLEAIATDATRKIDSFAASELASLLWSLSRQQGSVDQGFVESLISAARSCIDEFSGQHLAMVATAFTRLRGAADDPALLEAFATTARSKLRGLAPGDLASLTWSMAQLSVLSQDMELPNEVSKEAMGRMSSFNLHELTSLVSAYAMASQQDWALMRAVAREVLRGDVRDLVPQDLSRMQWACAKMLYADEELLVVLADASVDRAAELQPVNLANILWACAKLTTKTEALIDSLCGSSMDRIEEFSAQNLANTVWAIATLDFTITEKMEAFIQQSIQKIGEFGPQSLANTSWAFAKMVQKFDELMEAIATEAKARAVDFEPQNLSNTCWAFATLRIEDEELLRTLVSHAIAKISVCSIRDVASTCWAFARMHLANPELVAAAANVATGRLAEFEAKSLSNTCWAFATLALQDEPLMQALSTEILGKVQRSWADGSMKIEELATDLNGLTWAMDHAGVLSADLASTILKLMRRLGHAKDLEMAKPERPPPTQIEKVAPEDHPGDAPLIRADLTDMCCVLKPAGWEVDNQDAGGGPWLSSWLMEQFCLDEVPIVHYEEHQFGMVQRLDIPSSGLVLVGKTWQGFYSLKWQLQTGNLTREYVLLVHNWVDLDGKVNEHSFAEKAQEGSSAPAQLTVLAHLRRPDDEEEEGEVRMSLVVMRVQKSRRNDLRSHFAGAGHPTVADGKYSTREAYLRDREWCARKFMHCYRVEYRDSQDVVHECREPLPHDLRNSLAKLLPRGPESAESAEPWLDGEQPKRWDEYEGLTGADGIG